MVKALGSALACFSREEPRLLCRSEEDEGVVRAFQRGEREAFDELVRRYRAQVFRICYRFTGNPQDADDQAQEVFLRAYRALGRFRRQARFSTWLYRIAVNTCLNWAAASKTPMEALPETLADPAPGQLEQLSREQRCSAVREAVGRLPAKQRMTLVLRAYQGLSHREIAELMGSPLGTVKANYFFALQNLRKVLEASGWSVHGGLAG